MKNFFNQTEQIQQLIITMCLTTAQDLINDTCTTFEEKKALKKVVENIQKFNDSVFQRLGEGYKRTLQNKVRDNTFRIVSRYATVHTPQMSDTIDADILREIIDKFDIDCEGCSSENCILCTFYKIKSYLGIKGNSEDNNLCPYRKEPKKYDFIDKL